MIVEENDSTLGLKLLTPVNKAYNCAGKEDPSKLTYKCIRTLLLPRILDILLFYLAAVVFVWNYQNREYKYLAERVFNIGSVTSPKLALTDIRTILATLAFIVLTAIVFVLRVKYITSKRRVEKKEMVMPKESVPYADPDPAAVIFLPILTGVALTVVHFIASLILKKSWKEMPLYVDLLITAFVFLAMNLVACFRVAKDSYRCRTCHVIANMMDQNYAVAETFYANANEYVPTQRYTVTNKTYQGNKVLSEEAEEKVNGTVKTYENIRHDRNKFSCRCPYCLQVYAEQFVRMNDTFEGKEAIKTGSFSHTHRVK